MIENLNYISDDELEQLIAQVEQEELVTAPPDLTDRILEATVKSSAARRKEFYAYCFRVVTSVAAAVALVFLLPQMTDRAEVVKPVPDKATVMAAEVTPTKEEVLNDTGVVERIIRSTSWFNKQGNK